ncbi:Preprotein translocase subunit YidC [Priestia megaterium WSH-002]|uniref:Preprotein translocase subunit YidC n=1 Tax=Priestia megaterium (strain WSH-002) TaxID=1006007 RepID=A0A8D4BN85_PRIMW|nr:Preprotein translocase subunit YidC [Priestia megaterium WSH-002]
MMELLKENGANPLMGCIPLLVQLPVFSIVYYAIRRIDEISASSFLWLDLGHSDPYFILPIVAAVATYLQGRVMQTGVEGMNLSLALLAQILSPVMVLSFGIFFTVRSRLVLDDGQFVYDLSISCIKEDFSREGSA